MQVYKYQDSQFYNLIIEIVKKVYNIYPSFRELNSKEENPNIIISLHRKENKIILVKYILEHINEFLINLEDE